jgi:hypothetical protein
LPSASRLPRRPRAGLTERIVVNTGLAIDGYDPDAFFTDGMPAACRADLELRYNDVECRQPLSTRNGRRAVAAAIRLPSRAGAGSRHSGSMGLHR